MSGRIAAANLTPTQNPEPRTKCCSVCAFRKNDPQGIQNTAEWEDWLRDMELGLAVFYCVHTTDDQGRNQPCAGYNALHGPLSMQQAPCRTTTI